MTSPLLESVVAPNQSKRIIFLSTCPLDKHYIKFGCPKPMSFVQNVLPGS